MASTSHRQAWIATRLAEHHACERAKNPKLASALDRIDAAFPHPNPPRLEDIYPLAALHLSMDYARRFEGARVVIGTGFVEVELQLRADGSARVAA